jgi:hypothetical protein
LRVSFVSNESLRSISAIRPETKSGRPDDLLGFSNRIVFVHFQGVLALSASGVEALTGIGPLDRSLSSQAVRKPHRSFCGTSRELVLRHRIFGAIRFAIVPVRGAYRLEQRGYSCTFRHDGSLRSALLLSDFARNRRPSGAAEGC